MNHSQHDCLLVAVSTHENLGTLHAYDGTYKTDSICSNFPSDKCPTLAGKPKIFLIQACQGHKHDNGVTLKKWQKPLMIFQRAHFAYLRAPIFSLLIPRHPAMYRFVTLKKDRGSFLPTTGTLH